MKSVPSGRSLSRCQTIAGARPVTVSSATAMSRSQLEPGKTMTAVFMVKLLWAGGSDAGDAVILDHGVGEQLGAHRVEIGIGHVVGDLKLEKAAGAHVGDARKAQSLQRMVDRSEEHTSELQSLMRTSYAVFCLKNTKNK